MVCFTEGKGMEAIIINIDCYSAVKLIHVVTFEYGCQTSRVLHSFDSTIDSTIKLMYLSQL